MLKINRRNFLLVSGASLCTPSLALSNVNQDNTTEIEKEISENIRHNVSSFRALNWQPYFKNLRQGAILVDISSRALHYWSPDEQTYRLFPSSVPMSDDLIKTGRTKVTKKVDGPSLRPTPAMKIRNPEWPDFIGPGPENPLGTHALYLSWTYFRIHGTHDTRKIGRLSSNGCIGLYNQHMAELFAMTEVGTQVLVI